MCVCSLFALLVAVREEKASRQYCFFFQIINHTHIHTYTMSIMLRQVYNPSNICHRVIFQPIYFSCREIFTFVVIFYRNLNITMDIEINEHKYPTTKVHLFNRLSARCQIGPIKHRSFTSRQFEDIYTKYHAQLQHTQILYYAILLFILSLCLALINSIYNWTLIPTLSTVAYCIICVIIAPIILSHKHQHLIISSIVVLISSTIFVLINLPIDYEHFVHTNVVRLPQQIYDGTRSEEFWWVCFIVTFNLIFIISSYSHGVCAVLIAMLIAFTATSFTTCTCVIYSFTLITIQSLCAWSNVVVFDDSWMWQVCGYALTHTHTHIVDNCKCTTVHVHTCNMYIHSTCDVSVLSSCVC
jgi:hypothetical protein